MGRRKKPSKANEQGKGFVQIPRVMLESEAFKAIRTLAAAKALPVILCKFNAAEARGEMPVVEFTYTEALKVHGIARKSFGRGMKELHQLGFFDIHTKGGVREGNQWSSSRYRKSERWRRYGTRFFVEREWALSEPHTKSSALDPPPNKRMGHG